MILYKKEWNISLIMLFVLAIGSLIGLMSTNFIQDMISSTASLRDFYQSYYITKGWIELGILAVNRYDYGFEDTLTWSEDIIKNNLHCKKNCNLWLTITSRIKPQSNETITFGTTPEPMTNGCSLFSENKIILSGWSSYILPLFADQRKLGIQSQWLKNLFDSNDYTLNIISENRSNNSSDPIWIGIALWSWFKHDYENQSGFKQSLYSTGIINGSSSSDFNLNHFLYYTDGIANTTLQPEQSIAKSFWRSEKLLEKENFNYIFITNIWTQPYAFCLQAEANTDGYTLDNTIVTSIWSYWTTTIGLQANIKKPLADYIINSYSEY